MASTEPVVFGLVGLGGYAAQIAALLEGQSAGAAAPVRLAAVCEPDQVTHAARIAELRAKGVEVFNRYEDLLALPHIEAVWLPLPIDLHRPFTEQALAAGQAVLCEKPAAGCVDDLDAMIAARDRAGLPVAIGFQDVYDPTTLPLKRRLLEGVIGKIQHATVRVCWPRTDRYYARNAWAGRFERRGVWIMDSPANNAMAHYINIPLFLMGPTPETSAQPLAVEAELYRANPIENFDTLSMRVTLDGGVTLLVLLTHACEQVVSPEVVIHGQRGCLRRNNQTITLETPGGHEIIQRIEDSRPTMLRRFAKAVRGQSDLEVALATLEVARAQLAAVNGASEASPIHSLASDLTRQIATPDGKLTAIPGIEAAFETCVRQNRMLHESGLVNWSRPAGRRDLRGYRHFAGPASTRRD